MTTTRIACLGLFMTFAVACGDEKPAGSSASATNTGSAPKASSSAPAKDSAGGATTSAAPSTAAAPSGSAAAGGAKCKEAAEQKAKLKDPKADPKTLASVDFDTKDCESGKLSAGWADCVLGAKDYEAAKACK